MMENLKVNNLTVDLIQDQATVSLFKQGVSARPGKAAHTGININVPIATRGNQPESNLRRIAIDEAKRALKEAIQALDAYQI